MDYINKINKWHGCYDDSWQGIIVPEAFAHPAKMAYGLTRKIFKHALSEAWIKPGDVVVDPFGGIGSTGIVGACFGLKVVCVELEEKFCKLAEQNFERNRKYIDGFKEWGKPYYPVIIQGDSRCLSEVIAGADCVVGSPPYSETHVADGEAAKLAAQGNAKAIHDGAKDGGRRYGQTPGQLGAMKPGSIDAVVSSPPYAETVSGGGAGINFSKTKRDGDIRHHSLKSGQGKVPFEYGQTNGNLGNLKPGEVNAVVSSPPYEGIRQDGGRIAKEGFGGFKPYTDEPVHYGKNKRNPNNLGNQEGETFWQAAHQIVSECHKILKLGGYAIWVVKSFVRSKKIVDFPGDWRKLCESAGFETLHEHHAMLVKETNHAGLFGTITEKKERKSFFRRLAEKKGSPRIDYEVVLCMRRRVV